MSMRRKVERRRRMGDGEARKDEGEDVQPYCSNQLSMSSISCPAAPPAARKSCSGICS